MTEVRRNACRKYARPDARARGDQHVAERGRAAPRDLRRRPGRRAAPPRRRRGRRARLPARPARARAGDRDDPPPHPPATRYDVVHAHFGLSALPALAAHRGPVVVTLHGNDLFVRRSRLVTRAALPFTALPAVGLARVRPRTSPARARSGGRRAPRRHLAGALPPDPARGGPRAPGPRPRRAATCSSRTTPRGPLKRFDRAQEAAARRAAPDHGPRPARRGALLDQRRRTPCSCRPGRGLRPLRDRGARLRRARLRRRRSASIPSRSAGSRARSASRGTPPAGARRCARCSRRPTRASTGRGARRALLRRPHGGARRRGLAGGRRPPDGTYTRVFERVGDGAPDRL